MFGSSRLLGSYLMRFGFAGMSLVVFTACAMGPKTSGNQPTEPVASAGDTQPARLNTKTGNAVYNVPVPTDPKGQVIVNSVGITDLKRAGSKSDKRLPTLHVQLTVKNDTDLAAWNLDSRLQQVRFDVNSETGDSPDATRARSNEGLRPVFVSAAKGDKLPMISVAPGQTKKVELFYTLPADQRGTLDHQNFAIDWQLSAGKSVLNNSTVFTSIARNQDAVSVAAAKERMAPNASSKVKAAPDVYAPGVMAPAGLENDWWQNPAVNMPSAWNGF